MKKKLFFLSFIAALALTGCSSNDDLSADGSDTANGESRYLAVSIVSTDNGGTRATGDPSTGTQYGNYEDGLTNENTVNGLRIYFFDATGQPVKVKNTGNYYDVPKEQLKVSNPDANHDNSTVEKKIDAVLIVDGTEKMPTRLVAVVNPTEELGTDTYDLNGLHRFVNDYAKFANVNDQFVMTNSSYIDGGAMVEAETIMPENFQKDAEKAKENPVKIYVERAVAKVRVNNSIQQDKKNLEDGGLMFKVLDKDTKQPVTFTRPKVVNGTETTEEVEVWVKFYGWDITADVQYGWLLKNVRPSWRENLLGPDNPWNDAKNHRSYWADVCNGGVGKTNGNQYFSYANADNFKLTKFDGTEWKYCNENAEKEYTKGKFYKNTEVIIKGELCDGDGNPLTFTEIAGTRVFDDNKYTNLKTTYLAMLKSGRAHSHWKTVKDASGKVTGYKEISPEDVTFMTANEANKIYKDLTKSTTELENGRYYVYLCLTDDAAKEDWYTDLKVVSGTENDENPKYEVDLTKKVEAADVNKHLYEMGHAKIWNSGMTYYYTTIMQAPANGTYQGQSGVVRNHIYDINLKNVYGFGTPVYDPNEDIYPEKPGNDDTYVAAEIKILSWRLVSNDVDLEWD